MVYIQWGNGKTAESITGADIILEWNGVDGHPRVIYLQIKALFKGFNAYLKYAKKGATTDETTRWGGNNSTSPYFNALYKSSVNGNFQVTALEDAVWKGVSDFFSHSIFQGSSLNFWTGTGIADHWG